MRPLFDDLAAKLLDLSGAPNEIRIGLARSTTQSLEAFRAYLRGVEQLNRWDLAGAQRDLERAIALDTTFGLAYYKLALTRGWVGERRIRLAAGRSAAPPPSRATCRRTSDGDQRLSRVRARPDAEARALYQQLLARDASDADAWYGLGDAWFHDTAGVNQAPAMDPGDAGVQTRTGPRPELRPRV